MRRDLKKMTDVSNVETLTEVPKAEVVSGVRGGDPMGWGRFYLHIHMCFCPG